MTLINENKSYEKRMPCGKLHTQGQSYWIFDLEPVKHVNGNPVWVAVPIDVVDNVPHTHTLLYSYARYVQTNSYALEYISNSGFYIYTWKVTNGLEAQGLVQ